MYLKVAVERVMTCSLNGSVIVLNRLSAHP